MSDVNIAISNDVVKGIIEKKLQTTIASALSGEVALLEAIVKTTLSIKVDPRNGEQTNYGGIDMIEWYCRSAIKTQTGKAIEEWVKAAEPKIKAEIAKQLRGQEKNIAAKAVAQIVESASHGFNYKCEINLERTRD